jgi:hypothetical protein
VEDVLKRLFAVTFLLSIKLFSPAPFLPKIIKPKLAVAWQQIRHNDSGYFVMARVKIKASGKYPK